jgi:hypothetical protein
MDYCLSCESRNPHLFDSGFPFLRLRAEALWCASTGMTIPLYPNLCALKTRDIHPKENSYDIGDFLPCKPISQIG